MYVIVALSISLLHDIVRTYVRTNTNRSCSFSLSVLHNSNSGALKTMLRSTTTPNKRGVRTGCVIAIAQIERRPAETPFLQLACNSYRKSLRIRRCVPESNGGIYLSRCHERSRTIESPIARFFLKL